LLSPKTSRQLRNRADLALRAALRLDERSRQRVESLLLKYLRDKAIDDDIRTDCVFIGRALDEYSESFADAASRHALDRIIQTSELALKQPEEDVSQQIPKRAPKREHLTDLAVLADTVATLLPVLAPAEASKRSQQTLMSIL